MITQMKKYTFLVFHRDYEAFLTQLRDLGVVHITQKAAGLMEDDATLQAALQHEDELRRLIQQGAPDQLIQERSNIEQRIADTKAAAQQAAVWGDFDSERIQALKDAGYNLRFFACPTSAFQAEWGIKVNEKDGKTYFVVVSEYSESSDYSELPVAELPVPEKSAAQFEQEAEHLNGLLAAANARIEAWQLANLDQLKQELVEARQQIDWTKVNLSTDKLAEGALCLFEGFCPIDKEPELNAMLKDAQVYYEETDPDKEDATPIKLHNNWFIRLFEPLTGMYGWPNYNEFDPTPILGPFFLLFFALCIGDAGYGILLTLIGFLIYKNKLKIEMFKGMGGIIMALGVGSTLVGYLMGGFFGLDLYQASWFPESAKAVMLKNFGGMDGKIGEYDVMMVLAIVIGIVHLCLAMTIKAIAYTKRDGFRKTVSTWGWLLLIVGGIATGILTATSFLGPQVAQIILIVIGAISALGIFVFNTPGRNPLINIGAGLWDTYGMTTGLLGDVLSYIRLYALGLAGGMLGAAFNQLGTQVMGDSPNVGTIIGFILIVTFGHVLNLLMACLGAFVHPLRLSFVEYFKNSGYEGTGKKYQPFKK